MTRSSKTMTDVEGKLATILTKLQRTFDKEVSRVGAVEECTSRALLSCLVRHALDDFDQETRRFEPRDPVMMARAKLRAYLQGTAERESHILRDRIEADKKNQQREKILAAEFIPKLVKDARKGKEAKLESEPLHRNPAVDARQSVPKLRQSELTPRGRPFSMKSSTNSSLPQARQARPAQIQTEKPSLPMQKKISSFSHNDNAFDGFISKRRHDEFFNGEVLHVNPVHRHLYPHGSQQFDKKCVRIEASTANVQEALAREARDAKNRETKLKRDVIKSSVLGKVTGQQASTSATKIRLISSSLSGTKAKTSSNSRSMVSTRRK
ncbi:unnamed protein product, partial [Mesorhabditis belari]|uniref:Uncharacterized protein n=1 Tax=Mesorhabditis belari TaxID=2138241 RepID=A0AAF3EM60_9BILA